jgi:hypothetical protein
LMIVFMAFLKKEGRRSVGNQSIVAGVVNQWQAVGNDVETPKWFWMMTNIKRWDLPNLTRRL